MSDFELIVGTGSTWSIRALLCMKIAGITPKLTTYNLACEEDKARLKTQSETGLVPVLRHGALRVYDSLAIAEYVNELASGSLYPSKCPERARARSLCSELHSGFTNLRNDCPYTLTPQDYPNLTDPLKRELMRLKELWAQADGEFMFGEPSAVDAFYSVMASRLEIYGIYLEGLAGEYQRALLSWPLFKETLSLVDW